MKVSGIVANIPVADIEAASGFYTEYLGLSVVGFNMGWVAHYESPAAKSMCNWSPVTPRPPRTRTYRCMSGRA